MYKLCKTEQSAQRQRELEQQLLHMMETVPFTQISVSDLCTQAGTSRKAFYRYFSGKEGALCALIDHTLWELDSIPFREKPADPLERQEKVTWFFQFWQKQALLLNALARSGLSNVLLERMILYSTSSRSKLGEIMPDQDPVAQEYGTVFGVCGLMSVVFRWFQSGCRQSPEQMARIADTLLSGPLIR